MSVDESTATWGCIDFETWFPHKCWLSSWANDEQHSRGFRYKMVSMRPEPQGLLQLIVVLEEASGSHTPMAQVHASVHGIDSRAASFTQGLGKAYDITFAESDLSAVRTESELIDHLKAFGWYESP